MSDDKKKPAPPNENYPVPENHPEEPGIGSVRIHNNVIAMIAHETSMKVPGVVELSGTLVDGIADMIGRKSRDRGIRVAVEQENSVIVEMTVVIEYGVNIPDVCWQIQTEVRKAVEEMTGKTVQAVNVSVQGVRQAAEPGA